VLQVDVVEEVADVLDVVGFGEDLVHHLLAP